ncbi:MAG: hypothetical protein JKY71_00660 [Alphaproteobacteria bacterium]|nr:hypothetical protein [Alphaproteobacteria bacterium]
MLRYLRGVSSHTNEIKWETVLSRDDFTKKTIEIMAKKVGYLCSKPDCRKSTIGSKADGSDFMRVGTAAHITAASKGGPRYDPKLSPEERKHESNGIWLCPGCGRLVDADDAHFTVETIRAWKLDAEKRAFEAIAYALPGNHAVAAPSSVNDLSFVRRLGLSDADDVETSTVNMIKAAHLDISAFKSSMPWPKHPVFLGLKLVNGNETKSFSAENLAAVNDSFNEIAVIASPGTGKTTTLIQFSESILQRNENVAVYIPLSEWAVVQGQGFLQSISNRSAFVGFKPEHFMLMAHLGRLTLVLDGWNELNDASKQKVSFEIKSLKRDYPDIRIILSTRQKELDIPISGPVVKIDAISEEQQKEIALSLRGDEGERLLDHAWRTPGIRELISVPLYLTVLLSQTNGEALPTTKEEVLRMFVDNHEHDTEKALELQKVFLGVHREILNALAAEATFAVTTALSETEARSITKAAVDKLIEQGQIASPIEPSAALNSFVNLHTLIRSEEDGALSFQHQQFQEWYASFHVETLMLSAFQGNTEDQKTLRENIIDQRIWEESILFACERLSRADDESINAVAFVVLETLGIDPLLSAEIVYRSSDKVWSKVEEKVLSFVKNWHAPNQVDRAVSFMINTGRPEFLSFLWPLISNEDDQIHLNALRAGKRFRVSVLGSDIINEISKLNEKTRKHLVSEIAHYGDIPGIDLATQLAIEDSSNTVKLETVSSLLFRRANRQAIEILQNSPDEVWAELAKRSYADEISDTECRSRLDKELKKYIDNEDDPHKKLSALISLLEHSEEIAAEVEELLANSEPPVSKEPHYRWTVEHEYKKYPDAVINALMKRLEKNKDMPFMAEDYLSTSGIIIDEGPIVDRLLAEEKTERQKANTQISLAIIGPNTVGELIERLVEVNKNLKESERPFPESLTNEYHVLKQWICQTPDESFVQALIARAKPDGANEISLLADLITRHGDSHYRDKLNISDDVRERLIALVGAWGKSILDFQEARRYQLSEVGGAIGRVASPQLIPALQELLDEDLIQRQQQEKEFREALAKGQHINNDARNFFYRRYTEALAAIGDNAAIEILKKYLPNNDCGDDAALALRAIWKKNQPPSSEDTRFRPSPDFTEAKDRREQRRTEKESLASDQFAEDILAVVSGIISTKPDEKDRQHAFKLARIAFTMPYGDKTELIDILLRLPSPASEKAGALTALACAGEEIDAELVLQGIKDIYAAAEDKKNEWMLYEQDGYRMRQWMVLLPFSDNPEALIKVYEEYRDKQPHVCKPWNMRDVLSALKHSPNEKSVEVLEKLAEVEPSFLDEYDWRSALMKKDCFEAAQAFLNFTIKHADKIKGLDRYRLGEELGSIISKYPELRMQLYKNYEGAAASPSKAIMESAIEKSPDLEGIILLIRESAAHGRGLRDTHLYSAIKNLIVGERQFQNWIGAQELYGIPAQELRKNIFDLFICGNEAVSSLAKECLIAFDDIRDDYGIAESETRHPDITTGINWPQIEDNFENK